MQSKSFYRSRARNGWSVQAMVMGGGVGVLAAAILPSFAAVVLALVVAIPGVVRARKVKLVVDPENRVVRVVNLFRSFVVPVDEVLSVEVNDAAWTGGVVLRLRAGSRSVSALAGTSGVRKAPWARLDDEELELLEREAVRVRLAIDRARRRQS